MKETTQDEIFEEHQQFLGEKVQPDQEKVPNQTDFASMQVNLLKPRDSDNTMSGSAYRDWIRTAVRGMETWNQQQEEPLEEMSFEEAEKRVLDLISERPISFSTESLLISFNLKKISRAIATQLVRHRDNVYSQESFRVSYSGSNDFRSPESLVNNDDRDTDVNLSYAEKESLEEDIDDLLEKAHSLYNELEEKGIPREQARQVIPLGMTTSVNVTFTLRHFSDYLGARTHDIAQEEHTVLAALMVLELADRQPKIYEALETQIGDEVLEEIRRVVKEYQWIRDRYQATADQFAAQKLEQGGEE